MKIKALLSAENIADAVTTITQAPMRRSFPRMALILFILATISLAATTRAATLRWTYPLDVEPDNVQWLADGSGGVAAVIQGPTLDYLILWLDRNGKEVYKKIIPNPQNLNTFLVVAASANSFIYWNQNTATFIQVDRQGHESLVALPNFFLFPSRPQELLIGRTAYDNSGFFAISFDQATDINSAVVRYSYNP